MSARAMSLSDTGSSDGTSNAHNGVTLSMLAPFPSRGLIVDCWIAARWWVAGGELGCGVFGFPSLSFCDGVEEQYGPGWHVGVSGCGSLPPIRPVLHSMAGLDADGVEELPNEVGPVRS